MSLILYPTDSLEDFQQIGGGKATNLAKLSQAGALVPNWFCLTTEAYQQFVEENNLKPHLNPGEDLIQFAKEVEALFLKHPLSESLQRIILNELQKSGLEQVFTAVRSSGSDEDSPEFSFAGQFASFLYQKGTDAIFQSIKRCWASAFSERCISYRLKNNLPINHIQVAVVIQQMVNAESAGVAFSRNPVNLLDREHVVISSVWGLGEGLVSGLLDADHITYDRMSQFVETHIVEKTSALQQAAEGGLEKVEVPEAKQKISSLTEEQVKQVADLTISLEEQMGSPQDIEWAIEKGMLYCVQTRPITNLPPAGFFEPQVNGTKAILWDNSNIIESYSGVTSPLTFSFASYTYRQVYLQFCDVIGVPHEIVKSYDSVFRNMLGLLRGRVYYNLINWYKLVLLLPGAGDNPSFMETMMGVKQGLNPELADLFAFTKNPPQYSFLHKLKFYSIFLWRFARIKSIIHHFQTEFNQIYNEARQIDFTEKSLTETVEYYQYLEEKVLRNWKAPIINDTLCMFGFGLLKKITEKWIKTEGDIGSLQNDLLCGQGDIESTEPTKMLMRIANEIDNGDPEFREWFLKTSTDAVWQELEQGYRSPAIFQLFKDFLSKYGFRCINELKLEENDLHDDPSFVINAVQSYVRMRSYSIQDMEEREQKIKQNAEGIVFSQLSGPKKWIYKFVLRYARNAIRYRENLRFARTKIFGIVRHLFRGIGQHLHQMQVLDHPRDIFYLTVDEIISYIEGRPVATNLKSLIQMRKSEYEGYRTTPPPPDRLVTYGAVGVSVQNAQILDSGNLEVQEERISDDPNLLFGTPCCPGVIEGTVRVVKGLDDAEGLNGEILVTERTDPGWVPLYPSCSGLLIERGSLLSHSAVVARELGLPTIVGISGGMMQKLSTGDRVRVDAGKGEVKILL